MHFYVDKKFILVKSGCYTTEAKSGTVPNRDVAAQVEVVVAGALTGTKGIHANESDPRSGDVVDGDTLATESLGGMPGFRGA
jgi:hypothetical protein